ncbi:MAG: Asp-tRNA(Asn)/Glu-tRNA(Gln) amidotransferase subunit GatA [Candidatus Xenobium sp.]|nr:Asp-tRNA(Asn)/Glu-tRNA(Gln) amidotransferase subunit GatA [Burkholderiales bacterium]
MHRLTAHQLLPLLRERQLRARDLLEQALERIGILEPTLHAFLHLQADQAREQADRIDEELDAGRDPGPLAGLPVALKDNLCLQGMPMTCGSRTLESFMPPYDATVVRRLQAAGAIVVGKTNLDEFAMGSSTENSAFGPTRNPWDPKLVPGGSSGGSAVAVAAGMVPLALGSDTGGSIRQPAAFCGVCGLKPTYGRVSRYGLVAFASSLDQVGPLARDVRDCALLLGVLAGQDPLDSTCEDRPVPDYTALSECGVEGLRLGIPRTFLQGLEPEMATSFEEATGALVDCGARLVDVALPHLEYALPAYYVLASAEASSNLARFDGVRYGLRVSGPDVAAMMRRTRAAGFGTEVKRRIVLGTYTLSAGNHEAYYSQAQKVRSVISRDFQEALGRADLLVLPTTPIPAFPLDEKTAGPLDMYLSDGYTVGANLAGLPGLSIPMAPVRGLPAGLQVIGRAWDEGRLLACGQALQSVRQYHLAFPQSALGGGGTA